MPVKQRIKQGRESRKKVEKGILRDKNKENNENQRDVGFMVPISKDKCACEESDRCQDLRLRSQHLQPSFARRSTLIRVPKCSVTKETDLEVTQRTHRYNRFCSVLGITFDDMNNFNTPRSNGR